MGGSVRARLRARKTGGEASAVVEAVLGPDGRAAALGRAAAFSHAWAVAGGGAGPLDELGAAAPLVDDVARHAYRISDEDIAAARADGAGEDELFDLIVAAAAGAGMARREIGNAAISRFEEQR